MKKKKKSTDAAFPNTRCNFGGVLSNWTNRDGHRPQTQSAGYGKYYGKVEKLSEYAIDNFFLKLIRTVYMLLLSKDEQQSR